MIKLVKSASSLLGQSAQMLLENPTSSSGRNALLESVKGILSGTTGILDCFDEFEVRKIIEASNLVKASVAKIMATSPQKCEAFTHAAQLYSQNVTDLGRVSSKRIREIISPELKVQLQDALEVLVKETPRLFDFCKVAVQDVVTDSTFEPLIQQCGQRITDVCSSIEQFVQSSPLEESVAVMSDYKSRSIDRKADQESLNDPQTLAEKLQDYSDNAKIVSKTLLGK